MQSLTYQPAGFAGYSVALTTSVGGTLTADLAPGSTVPSLDGPSRLLSNDSLTTNLVAFGLQENAARRARAEEKRKSHRVQADRHEAHVLAIGELIEALGPDERSAWCSACFASTSHRRVSGRRTPTYLCKACGAPTTPCAWPSCNHQAVRSLRAVSGPRYCAEHRHEIPAFERVADRIPTLDTYHHWLKFESVNALRLTRIAGSVVIAGACVTPAAWAMAPTIGGALGGLTGLSGAAATSHGLAMLGGGSLAAGGFGMAGGTFVVAAAGGALGGAMGGAITTAYVRADSSFRIERLRTGSGTPVVLANGFLTDGSSGWAQWQPLIDAKYPDAPVYRVHWGAKELADLGSFVGIGAGKQIGKQAFGNLARKASKQIGSLPGLGALLAASDLAANPWTVARTRADMTGAVLADLIARSDEERFILVGHSLGGRVMVRAAQNLSTLPAPVRVESVHLLGTAVSRGEDWRTLQAAVADHVWNYHSGDDRVLSLMYPAAQAGRKAVGSKGFGSAFPKIVDRDVTLKVKAHSAYFEQVKLSG